MVSDTTVFNIDNNPKCFLSIKPAYLLKDHVTVKTGVMMVEYSFAITVLN